MSLLSLEFIQLAFFFEGGGKDEMRNLIFVKRLVEKIWEFEELETFRSRCA